MKCFYFNSSHPPHVLYFIIYLGLVCLGVLLFALFSPFDVKSHSQTNNTSFLIYRCLFLDLFLFFPTLNNPAYGSRGIILFTCLFWSLFIFSISLSSILFFLSLLDFVKLPSTYEKRVYSRIYKCY